MSSRLPEKEEVVIGGVSRSGSVVTLESVTLDSTAAATVSENVEASVTSSSSDNLVLFDSDLMSWTRGFPLPLTDAAKKHLDAALRRDCDFLSEAEVIDYSLLVGVDIESGQIRIGIVDYLRRFDIVKRVENRVKAVAQLATNVEPTVVQPSRYGERLLRASERYFMSVRQID
jgi:1-phosphatidylinositol-3-phosphate 5-kinase